MENTLDIGVVSVRSGLSPSTLRYYEEIGLIHAAGRKGLRRFYRSNVIERLALIALGQQSGFTLNEIRKMFTPKGPKIDRNTLKAKADALDKKIRTLIAMSKGLRHAAVCSAPDHLQCPKFLRLMRHAMENHVRISRRIKN